MIIVNKFRTALNSNEKFINIPVEINFDVLGRDMIVDKFVDDVTKDLTNPIKDFDVTKFSHKDYINTITTTTQIQIPFVNPLTNQTTYITTNIPITTNNLETSINYEFYFFNNFSPVTASTVTNWEVDYESAGFNDNEIYYFANNFKGSFFKIDFYDKPTNENQQILLSLILPTQQGEKEQGFVGPPQNQRSVLVKRPKFKLDSQGADKEGFYVYWVKDKTLIDVNEFYVSAKFFNAKIGQFVRMVNSPQSQFPGISTFNINKENYFYYKYVLDYDTFEYQAFKIVNNTTVRVGTIDNPIKWYEYINP